MERKAHVWAAVVAGVDAVAIGKEGDGVAVEMDYQSSLLTQLGEARRSY
jgi:hypothetical protein